MMLPDIQDGYSRFQLTKQWRPSSVEIFSMQDREQNSFKLPCFRQLKCVIVLDSMGRNFKSYLLPEKGVAVLSMSGLDLLELSLLFSYGQLYQNTGDKYPILMTERKNFGLHNLPMPKFPECRHCRKYCHKYFSGDFILNVSINNSLKCDRKSYHGQDIGNLFDILETQIKHRLPKLKKLIFIRPLMPINRAWRNSELARDTFDHILRILSRKEYVVGDPFFAKDREGHSPDGIHLEKVTSESYFRIIMRDISELTHFNIN